jgi:FkbM family methyltransferase
VTATARPCCDLIVAAMHDGSYERNEQDLMRLVVRPGMHVADVGAHIGFHTRHLADLVGPAGSVTAFEPIAEHASALVHATAERRWQGRVRFVQAAVADAPGTRPMVVGATGFAAANAYLDPAGAHPELVELCVRPLGDDKHTVVRPVPVVTLDEAISTRPVGFLKIDVEGAEALVLRGARRLLAEDCPVVLADLHPHLMAHLDGTTPARLIREMAALRYECRLLGAGVPGPRVTDIHARGVTPVIFLSYGRPSFSSGESVRPH